MSLAEKLDAIRAAGAKRIPPEKRTVITAFTQGLRDSNVAAGFIRVGDRLPDFALESARGHVVRSEDLLSKGAVVLTVFRGHW